MYLPTVTGAPRGGPHPTHRWPPPSCSCMPGEIRGALGDRIAGELPPSVPFHCLFRRSPSPAVFSAPMAALARVGTVVCPRFFLPASAGGPHAAASPRRRTVAERRRALRAPCWRHSPPRGRDWLPPASRRTCTYVLYRPPPRPRRVGPPLPLLLWAASSLTLESGADLAPPRAPPPPAVPFQPKYVDPSLPAPSLQRGMRLHTQQRQRRHAPCHPPPVTLPRRRAPGRPPRVTLPHHRPPPGPAIVRARLSLPPSCPHPLTGPFRSPPLSAPPLPRAPPLGPRAPRWLPFPPPGFFDGPNRRGLAFATLRRGAPLRISLCAPAWYVGDTRPLATVPLGVRSGLLPLSSTRRLLACSPPSLFTCLPPRQRRPPTTDEPPWKSNIRAVILPPFRRARAAPWLTVLWAVAHLSCYLRCFALQCFCAARTPSLLPLPTPAVASVLLPALAYYPSFVSPYPPPSSSPL